MPKRKKTILPSEKQVEKYERLEPLLDAAFIEIKELSKKKPDGALNKLKIQMINKILEQVKDFLSSEPNAEFLGLLDEATVPTYSDAVLIVGQFRAVLIQFRKKFYGWDDNIDKDRWFTQENPPITEDDYNEDNEKNEDLKDSETS